MLTNYERETIINYNEEEATASVYTHNRALINKLKGLVKEYNLEVEQLESAYEFTVPKKWIKVKPPRKVSAENREKMSQRAKKMWENRDKNYEQ